MAKRHFVTNFNIKKILNARYWWPTLLKDTHIFAKAVTIVKKLEDEKQKVWSSW